MSEITDKEKREALKHLYQGHAVMVSRVQSAYDALDEQNMVIAVNCLNVLESMMLKQGAALALFLDEAEIKESWKAVSKILDMDVNGFQISPHRSFELE